MSAAETALQNHVLLEIGSRDDGRFFRNAVFLGWQGRYKGVTRAGDIILHKGATRMRAGLADGSGDVIGIGPGGIFTSVELKTRGTTVQENQIAWANMVIAMGGRAGIARDVDEAVRIILGEPVGL